MHRFWVDYSVLNTDAVKSWHSPHRGPYVIVTILLREEPCSTSYLATLAKTPGNGLALASTQCECVKLFRPPSLSDT